MVAQVPKGAVGIAIGVEIYTLFCAFCNCLMIWLVWIHHGRTSYVALLSYFTLLSTMASFGQQLHTVARWRGIKIEQYQHALATVGDREAAITGQSVGVDLVLFYIQYYAYNVEALLSFLWACALTQTIYGYTDVDVFRRLRRLSQTIIKIVAVLLPAILLSLLRIDTVRQSPVAVLMLADVCIFVSLSLGGILLLAILGKYIHTRRKLLSWHVNYGNDASTSRRTERLDSFATATTSEDKQAKGSIYDRWLLVRFSIAFVVIGCYEAVLTVFQISQMARSGTTAAVGDAANLSLSRARSDFLQFMVGVSASLLVFVVFGTTRPFRQTVREAMVPRCFRREKPAAADLPVAAPHARRERLGSGSVIILQNLGSGGVSTVRSDDEWPLVTRPASTRAGV
ncbi:hypothetical protein F4779DRAFT_566871 [Xylariaceae sp. FL0662B]|nr:hypothetical protein F4779DRAFT_566871 [Xylariaceae sp. FL0662B]